MKRIIPILMALLLLSVCATQSAKKTYRQITMEEAVTMLEEETGYTILDVRTAQEYSEKHIPGAINIANESIGTKDIPELPDKDQLILVYCRSGNRSKQASEKLENWATPISLKSAVLIVGPVKPSPAISDKITEKATTTGYTKAIKKKTGGLKYVCYQCK